MKIHYVGNFKNELVAIKEQSLGENEPDSSLIALLREITILTVCNNQHIQKLIGVYFNSQRL